MILQTRIGNLNFSFDSSKGIEVSVRLNATEAGPNCFYAPPFDASPLISGDFIGDTRKGSPVNFYNIKLNPHGNGTHTECVGHISEERISIADVLQESLFYSRLVSVIPHRTDTGDKIITAGTLKEIGDTLEFESALLVRSQPNPPEKQRWIYSGTNPAYFEASGLQYLREKGIFHLLTDLPSVDREEDGGRLEGHKAFWNYPNEIDRDRTITEMIFVPDHVPDGQYLVHIQIPPFELDAAPSRVFLYPIVA